MVILTDVLEQSSSSNNYHEKYDVFLSFRGVDTRLSFTNHLHKSLEGANLKTFLDNEDIPTGLYLKPELENAIKSSAASVIVLSKNYATSTWCLEELVLILERHKNFKQIVIPIFYHVEPTDVGKQQNSFGDAMEEHKQKMEAETDVERKSLLAEKLKIWKEALTKVSKITGMDVRGRLETEFIDEIVKDVSKRIRVPIRSTPPLLIGMDYSVNFITSWLKDGSSHTVDILTIYGMGGIGKSSLAKYVYGSHCREFDSSSIIENISSRICVEKIKGLLDLQKQLCGDISKTSPIQVRDGSRYTSIIENALAFNKVFIVLDDIDSLDQLDALLGNKEIKAGYEEVSEDILKYCAGHPLALKVLGRYLYNRDVSYWEACIQELKKGPEGPVYHVNSIFKMSFKSLEYENDKELFKYIACFFVGIDRDIAETILKACGINTGTGITNLIDRCLLRIGRHNELMMHSLIQEMGRYVVDHEYKNPEERSLLWRSKESFEVLKKKTGTRNIKGLSLSRTMIEDKKLPGSLLELETDAFSKMSNLKMLQLTDVRLNDSYENFPEELIWLCIYGFPLEFMPSELPMKKLVALYMPYSNMKSFDMSSSNMQQSGKRKKVTGSCAKSNWLLGSLKILDLSHSYQLHTLGGFCELPALETLILKNCTSLVEVCETIEQCHELVYVDLSHSNKCRKLLQKFVMLKSVQTLILSGFFASKLTFRNFRLIEIYFSSSLVILSLEEYHLSCESFPTDCSFLFVLKELQLGRNPIVSKPNCVITLPGLKMLGRVLSDREEKRREGCYQLKELPPCNGCTEIAKPRQSRA